jgi:hypothetical protein
MNRVVLRASLGVLSLLAIALVATDSSAGAKAKVYKTPQEVFDAVQKAGEKQDWKALLGCITADSRDEITGTVVFGALLIKGFGKFATKEEEKANLKKIETLLDKHGITEENLAKLKKDDEKADLNDPVVRKKVMKLLASVVKDKEGFILEFIAAVPPKDKKQGAFEDLVGSNPTLKNVKIDGDSAKGTLVGTRDGMEVTRTLDFRREGGSWRIDLPMPDPKKK